MPGVDKEEAAHFFKPDATSTFMVSKKEIHSLQKFMVEMKWLIQTQKIFWIKPAMQS